MVEQPLHPPGLNEVLIRNVYAGVNGVLEFNLIRNLANYLPISPPAGLGSEAIGWVEEIGQGVSDIQVGDVLATSKMGTGYQEYQIANVNRVYKVREPSPQILTLVSTGASALVGLETVGDLKGGETVAISAAAGGLGHIAVQIAKLAGNHVIGICGSDEKCAALKQIGCDRPINYKTENLGSVLGREYGNGIDLAYDSVGGPIYDALVNNLADMGRLVVCGRTYEAGRAFENVVQPRPTAKLYFKSASIRGFMSRHYQDRWPDAVCRILDLYERGKLTVFVDPIPFKGLESIPDAVEHLLSGKNLGKVVVRIGS